jgi:uncharacterized protein YndB with AHSA1/START domain
MSKIAFETIIVERNFTSTPDEVFAAFTTREAVERWMSPGEGFNVKVEPFDFREGGGATTIMSMDGDDPWINTDSYHEILPGRRIIETSTLRYKGALNFAGLVTIAFEPAPGGCALEITEMGAFPDGKDEAEGHEETWKAMLDSLAEYLKT